MKETSKAMARRWAEHAAGGFHWHDLFKGNGLDVGSGDDPLGAIAVDGEQIGFAKSFNLEDGGGDDLREFFELGTKFDFIHGSQVLEHMLDPVAALHSWLEMLNPGGHIIATVPDFATYEKCLWPSAFNAGHRSTWSMLLSERKNQAEHPENPHIKLPEWLNQFFNSSTPCTALLCRFVDTNFNYDAPLDLDQTWDSNMGVECFIEFVLRRR